MKKALIYALALALALSLTACGQPKTEQPTDPAPSTSAPEPIATPEPIKDTTPEPEPEQTPAAPVETEDTQPPEETESEEVESQVEEVQLFTDCNETVYATGTVNIRSSWSAESEKLGSLNKGDSVTRTGTSIAGTEAEGWSRIQLSDGTVVYISNQYLSTTKPVQQQNTQSQGNQQTQTSGSQQQTQQTQQTSSSQKIDGHDDLGDYVLNGKGGKYYPALGITLPVSYDGTTTNGAPPQTAEEQEAAKKEYEAGLESSEHHTESWAGVSMGG